LIKPGSTLKAKEEEWNPEESPAVILGAGGIYGIVIGLGISDAIGKYTETIGTKVSTYLSNNPGNLLGILTLDLPYSFRLIGFLVTILPFIHGAILSFSNKWYYNQQEKKSHFGLAFIFLIVVFIHTILFFFTAVNLSSSLFILSLFLLMGLNTPWLLIQGVITRKYVGRNDLFIDPWVLLNFNTFAFLAVFIFGFPNLFGTSNDVDSNYLLNLLILIVLTSRSVVDYIVGWKSLYNKMPASGMQRVHEKTL
jgi:hypothetical protein